MLREVEQRFKTGAEKLSVLQKRTDAAVARWVFSTMEIWSYHDMRELEVDSSRLPSQDGALFACGYDAWERPIILKHFDSETVYSPHLERIPKKETWAEEFIAYDGDILDVARFVRGELEAKYRLTFRDKLLVEEECIQHGVYQHTLCFYEGRRLRLQQSLSENGQLFFEIAFAPDGQQTYFRVKRDGTRFQLGQPLPKGVTIKSLKRTIRNRLLTLIPEIVASSGIQGLIYCVALAYDGEGNDALPPLIGIGLESERQGWKIKHGKAARQWIWNPAEFYHYEKSNTQLKDEELEEACDYLNAKLAENGSALPAIKLLLEVARELNLLAWPKTIQRTSDFCVYAVDFELGDLKKNLKLLLPPKRLAALKSAQLL